MSVFLPTEEQFIAIFPDHPELYFYLTTKPKNLQDLVTNYLPSKFWRLNNLYTVIDKDGEVAPFRMSYAQLRVYAALLHHPRVIILKSRQQGVSTFYLLDFFDDAVFRSNLNVGLMAQGREEASTLLDRVKFAWDMLGDDIKQYIGRKKIRDNSSEFAFNNNSTIFIRTSFRSATLQRLHISEYGKIANESPKKAKETKTGTLQTLAAGNPGAIESTAEGHNDFKTMWDAATANQMAGPLAGKAFYPLFLSWLEDPTCVEEIDQLMIPEAEIYFKDLRDQGFSLTRQQMNFWIVQYHELGEDIYQEYPATPAEAFRASRDGTYWAKKYQREVVKKGHVIENLFDRNLPVYAAVDSGMDDYFVFVFFQVWKKEIRIIGEFWHNNEALDYYAEYLQHHIPKEWEIRTIYLPHDFSVRDMSAKGKTRQEIWADEDGITNTEVLDKEHLADSIALVRSEMSNIYIDANCTYLDSCFLNYEKKWDKVLVKWSPKPADTDYRHGADGIRYMVQAVTVHLREGVVEPGEANVSDGVAL